MDLLFPGRANARLSHMLLRQTAVSFVAKGLTSTKPVMNGERFGTILMSCIEQGSLHNTAASLKEFD